MRPDLDTDSCQMRHIAYVVSARPTSPTSSQGAFTCAWMTAAGSISVQETPRVCALAA